MKYCYKRKLLIPLFRYSVFRVLLSPSTIIKLVQIFSLEEFLPSHTLAMATVLGSYLSSWSDFEANLCADWSTVRPAIALQSVYEAQCFDHIVTSRLCSACVIVS